MFTGIITDIGKIVEIQALEKSSQIIISTIYDLDTIDIGASIACNGCCLTVVKKKVEGDKNLLFFDVSPESIDKTIFQFAKTGDEINLERAMKLSDGIGGHLVSGHVDCLAEIFGINIIEGNWITQFKVPKQFTKYIVAKGSVVINGASLTVNNVENDIFDINIIPHTLEKTNLRNLKIGSKVNFEVDLIARYLEKLATN